MNDFVEYYLQKLRQLDHEDAFFSLVEADHSIVPQLIEAYMRETDWDVRATIIEVIWQHRLPTSLDFLADALRDEHPKIWKAALDGIVTIGGKAGKRIFEKERERLLGNPDRTGVRLQWIEKAIEQLNNAALD